MVARAESVRGEPINGKEFDDEAEIDLELEITDSPTEKVVDDVWDEIFYRQSTLGDLYPFKIEPRSTGWKLSLRAGGDQQTRIARGCYVACLLVSALRSRLLPGEKKTSVFYKKLYKNAPDAFQAVSYLGAPEILGGEAYWFGWPRIKKTTKYVDALKDLVGLIGHGRLKEKAPDWSTNAEKDGTVDIIAWRSFRDSRYGSALLYGQVASGSNWRDKPIGAYIKGYFFDWFEDTPSTKYLPAMFMPFLLHHDLDPKKGVTFDEAAIAAARRDSSNFGMILDRLRLTELAYHRGRNFESDTELRDLGAQVYRWSAQALFYARSVNIPA